MKLFLLSLFAFFLLIETTYSQCVTDENNVYSFSYEGVDYEVVKENLNWVDASACAVERGGFLSEIDSQDEQDAVFNSANEAGVNASNTVAPDGGGASYLWIGGNDIAIEGNWVWDGDNDGESNQFWQGTSSGSPVGGLYNNWGNEPDDYAGQDGLGLAFTDWPLGVAGQWNDVDDSNTLYYIIEYPESSTGMNDVKSIPELKIYPNPANDIITISLANAKLLGDDQKLVIFNLAGVIVKEISVETTTIKINTEGLDSGVYFVQFGGVNPITKKLIIQK